MTAFACTLYCQLGHQRIERGHDQSHGVEGLHPSYESKTAT